MIYYDEVWFLSRDDIHVSINFIWTERNYVQEKWVLLG